MIESGLLIGVPISSGNVEWVSEVAQSCLTLCNPMDCSLPGSSVHGIFQASILEWVAIFFSRGSSQPRDWTQVSRIACRRFTIWATWKCGVYWKAPYVTKASQVALVVKNPPANAGDPSLILGRGNSPGEENGNPLQYACLEKSHEWRSLAGYSPWGHRVRHDWATTLSLSFCILSSVTIRYWVGG